MSSNTTTNDDAIEWSQRARQAGQEAKEALHIEKAMDKVVRQEMDKTGGDYHKIYLTMIQELTAKARQEMDKTGGDYNQILLRMIEELKEAEMPAGGKRKQTKRKLTKRIRQTKRKLTKRRRPTKRRPTKRRR